jgi:hypothetical protein
MTTHAVLVEDRLHIGIVIHFLSQQRSAPRRPPHGRPPQEKYITGTATTTKPIKNLVCISFILNNYIAKKYKIYLYVY